MASIEGTYTISVHSYGREISGSFDNTYIDTIEVTCPNYPHEIVYKSIRSLSTNTNSVTWETPGGKAYPGCKAKLVSPFHMHVEYSIGNDTIRYATLAVGSHQYYTYLSIFGRRIKP